MKKIKQHLLVLCIICITLSCQVVLSQTGQIDIHSAFDKPSETTSRCGSDQMHYQNYEKSSSYRELFSKMNINWQAWAIENKQTSNHKINGTMTSQSYPVVTLPVIFHDFTNMGAGGLGSYATQHALYLNVLSSLNAKYLSVNVQFCLAEINNQGATISNYTYATAPTFTTLDQSNPGQINSLNQKIHSGSGGDLYSTTKYINIYIVDDIAGPTAGFAMMPPSHGALNDGIYIEKVYIANYNTNSNIVVLTHEMGHYLGLFHTFGICKEPLIQACSCDNNNCLFDGDMVCDTPPDFSTSPMACGTYTNTCHTDHTPTISDGTQPTTDINDLTTNYMDYGNWTCMNAFTAGQIKRMRFMIDAQIGPRNSLLNSNVCTPACANNTCTVSINPITTSTVNGVYLPNTLITSGGAVSYNFTGSICSTVYNTLNWKVINLTTNTTFSTGTTANLNVTFASTGNYRVILKASKSANSICTQSDTLDIQVLPPPSCPNNLDMSAGWSQNWQRTQYEGGWARTSDNGTIFTFPTTTMTPLPSSAPNGTANTDPFSMITSLAADPNFNTLSLPAGVPKIMRVGKLITANTTLPAGDAACVTYTFCPTVQNSKLKVYYLGMREQDPLPVYMSNWVFAGQQVSLGNMYGFVCKYEFNSVEYPGTIAQRGTTQTGSVWNALSKNDMMNGGLTSPVSLNGKNYDKMTGWEYKILDFSDFVCASPTITITFFARSDNQSTLGYHHCYSYFAAQCLPGDYQPIVMNLPNKDISCANSATQSCTSVDLPAPYTTNIHEGVFQHMTSINIQESHDNLTYTTVPVSSDNSHWYYQSLILCKNPDNHPYKYYRITYKTLCQTLVDTVTIYQGFVHNLTCAPNSTVPISGGHYINPPVTIGTQTISPDKYVQLCDFAELKLTEPCWTTSNGSYTYQWQYFNGSFVNFPNYMAVNNITTAPTLTINNLFFSQSCKMVRRVSTYYDPYCDNYTQIPSDTFYVTSYKASIYDFPNYVTSIIGPDVCGNSPSTIKIRNLRDNSHFTCDPEIMARGTVINTITVSYYSNANCTPSSSLTAMNGPSVQTFTYSGFLDYSQKIDTSFTFFNNNIYTQNGAVYILLTVNQYSCVSTVTLSTQIKIKPSAMAGTIAPVSNGCLNPTVITGNDANVNVISGPRYAWQYSYNNNFSTAYTIAGATSYSCNVPAAGTFTNYPVYLRRVAIGTQDCPDVAYSNTVMLGSTPVALTISATNTVICQGQGTSCPVLTASGASTYTWSNGAHTNTVSVCPPVSTTYSVTGLTSSGCIGSGYIAIMVNPLPAISITGPNNICPGQTTTLTANGGSSYLWNTGVTTNTIIANTTGVLTVTVTNLNGCKANQSVTITANPIPTVSISGNTSVCVDQTTTLLSATGGSTYLWNTGINTNTLIANTTGVLTVTVTNTSGCKAVKSVTISANPIPTVAITGNTIICPGQTTTLTATSTGINSYVWDSSPATTTNTLITNTAGVKTVTITNTFGCSASQSLEVTVAPLPTIQSTGNSTICANQCTTINIDDDRDGTTYSLSTSGTTHNARISNTSNTIKVMFGTVLSYTVCPTVSTIYTITATSDIGCVSTKTIQIVVNPVPNITIGSITNTTCVGGCTTLTASGANTYTWNTGALTNTTSACQSIVGVTTYSVKGTNAMGCIDTKTISVIANVCNSPCGIKAAFLWDNCVCTITNSSSATGSVTIQNSTWTVFNPAGAIVLTTTNTIPVITSLAPGYYTVCLEVTGSNGCKSSLCKMVNQNCSSLYERGVTETNAYDTKAIDEIIFNIYPNPATSHIDIVWNIPKIKSLTIMDITGKIIHKVNLNEQNRIEINLQDYVDGLYFVNLQETSGKMYSKKINIQK